MHDGDKPFSVATKGSARIDRQSRLADNLTLGHQLRDQLKESSAIGTFLIELPAPATVSALAMAGFDFIVIDLEHSSTGFEKLELLILAAHSARIPAIVRPWRSDPGLIGKILDLGANGIMAPHVETVEQARDVVRACRYTQDHGRGYSPLTKFHSLPSPIQDLSKAVFVIVQLEGRESLKQAGAITKVEGLDAIFVGPYDLALSLGVASGDPMVTAAARRIAEDCTENISLGIYIDDPSESADWAAANFRLQCASFDGQMLAAGAAAIMSKITK
ncbi:HpcH/HpaI aldolase family protein [Parasphingorhabdus sp.]|uniref:HpcH/HpaI aldolase family protein n=1 Tax=Parasphingorhabdus sp. TaxID=2709688 RepID=UPI002B265F45|nr:aldolase/citrate lyase family protein [Parasphingorhabdus sp.]